eukprot:7627088-Alexandrium_andersonii.AAC.1
MLTWTVRSSARVRRAAATCAGRRLSLHAGYVAMRSATRTPRVPYRRHPSVCPFPSARSGARCNAALISAAQLSLSLSI